MKKLTVSSLTGTYKQSGPVNSMSSAGWQSGVLPYKLEVLTQDHWVLQTVGGHQLELTTLPHQSSLPHTIKCSAEAMAQITTEVVELLSKGAIVETRVTPESFISQLFLVEKKGGGRGQ